MNIFSLIAIYFVLWWIAFLITLPFGVQPIAEKKDKEKIDGCAQSAPQNPYLLRKALVATGLSGIFLALLSTGIVYGNFLERAMAWFPPLAHP